MVIMKKILVLMSAYNGENTIKEQIDTILNQAGCEVSLLVRDDSSEDHTKEIVESYIDAGRPIALMDGCENLRPARSFMELLYHAPSFDYYAFSDQDDSWDSDKLQRGIQMLQAAEGPSLYCANARIAGPGLEDSGKLVYQYPKRTDFKSVMITGNFMGCTMVFNRALKDAFCRWAPPEYCIMHDSYLTALCAMLGGKIIFDPSPHMSYRQTGHNTVGLSLTKAQKLKRAVKSIVIRGEPRIAKQCAGLLAAVPEGPAQSRAFLSLISSVPTGSAARRALLRDPEIHYESFHQRLVLRNKIKKGCL